MNAHYRKNDVGSDALNLKPPEFSNRHSQRLPDSLNNWLYKNVVTNNDSSF